MNPQLTDYNYAAETYDAITIIALAVEQAKDDGIAYAEKINGITRTGDKCTDFKSCKAIIDAGGDPDYDGISGPLEVAGNGEPMPRPSTSRRRLRPRPTWHRYRWSATVPATAC